MNYFQRVAYPERFQGWGKQRNYFEGWYYKLVVPGQQLAYAVIPGISLPKDGKAAHAFIQVLDGVKSVSAYHRFSIDAFSAKKDAFAVSIADNHFTDRGVHLNLPGLSADIDFIDAKPWPKKLASPGVMGWYGYIPVMECYHGLVSLHHGLSGHLHDYRGTTKVDGGTGYIEKDWGRSFPNAWIWTQSNHLASDQPASLMVSVADIPWIGTSFVGFLSTFLFEGELHTMATWTGAKAKVRVAKEEVEVTLRDKRRELIVSGKPAPGGDLASPIAGAMTGKINESLQAELMVTFTLDGTIRYQGPAKWAGLEVTDNAQDILV